MSWSVARRTSAAAVWGRRAASQGASSSGTPPCGATPCGPTQAPPCRAASKPLAVARVQVCCPPAIGNRPPCPVKNLEKSWTCENPLRQKKQKPCVEVPDSQECECDDFYVMRRIEAAKALHRKQYQEEVCAGEPAAEPPDAPYCLPAARATLVGEDGRRMELLEALPPPRCGPPGCAPPPRDVLVAPAPCPRAAPRACDHAPRPVLHLDRCTRRPAASCAGASLPCHAPNTDNPCGLPTAHKPDPCSPSDSKNEEGMASRLIKSLSVNKKNEPKKHS